MADLNMSAEFPSLDTVKHFAPKTLIQSQALQNTQKAETAESIESKKNVDAEKDKRQEIATEKLADVSKDLSQETLDDTISQLNNSLQNIQRNLEFSIDKDVGMIVINVKDKETDEVVRQIPSKEVLELAKNLQAANERLNQHYEARSQSYGEGVFLKTKV